MSEASAAQASNGPHPLQFKWTLWHDTPAGKGKDYAANLRQIASFDTVEDFWAYVLAFIFIRVEKDYVLTLLFNELISDPYRPFANFVPIRLQIV